MKATLPPKNHPNVMLVEGRDDIYAIANLLQRHAIAYPATPWSPLIKDFDGVDALLDVIPVSLKSRCARLAVVIDADLDTKARWDELRGKFAQAGVILPTSMSVGGTIIDTSSLLPASAPRRVGVWVMPDNREVGGLEGFLRQLVPSDDLVWDHAVSATASARNLGAPLTEVHVEKANLHTWLAWQEPPALPFGTALTAHVLNHDTPIALAFVGDPSATPGRQETEES